MSEPCTWCAQNFPAVDGRDVAALQDPRPMAVIGAAGTDGEACFATVIWVTPLSHTPPMLAFALREKSRTMQLIKQVHACSITTLPAAQEAIELAEYCGTTSGNKVDKGAHVSHFMATAQNGAAVPVPEMAYSWTVCEVESIQETGDHLLAICRVDEAHIDCQRDAKGQLIPHDVLLCVQHGTYAADRVL